MAYKVNTTIESEGVQTGFMPVGIHDNCELVSVRTDKSKNGNNFIEFKFKNDLGEELAHTEWEPTDKDPIALEEKQVKQIKRIKQIVTKFVNESEYVVDAPDFSTFALKTINVLGNKYLGKKVRLKVVYNYQNFTSLPSYAKYQFIESMDVLKEKSKIKILALDKMIRTMPAFEDGSSNNGSPFNNTDHQAPAKAPISSNDLPF
jgi:hypothetical protein